MGVDFNQGFEAGLKSCQRQMESKYEELKKKLEATEAERDHLLGLVHNCPVCGEACKNCQCMENRMIALEDQITELENWLRNANERCDERETAANWCYHWIATVKHVYEAFERWPWIRDHGDFKQEGSKRMSHECVNGAVAHIPSESCLLCVSSKLASSEEAVRDARQCARECAQYVPGRTFVRMQLEWPFLYRTQDDSIQKNKKRK